MSKYSHPDFSILFEKVKKTAVLLSGIESSCFVGMELQETGTFIVRFIINKGKDDSDYKSVAVFESNLK